MLHGTSWDMVTWNAVDSKNNTSIDPKQHKFQNHMSALCHAHRFLWFPCMGLRSVMSIDLKLCVFFLRRLAPPPGCFQSNTILWWIVAHVYYVHKLPCWCADILLQCYGHRLFHFLA